MATLAYQVKPDITPATVRSLLARTATKTPSGPIANPRAFIDAVRAGAEP